MNSAPWVSFRVDVGPEIGLGHLRRCSVLARQLRDLGCNVRFLCRGQLGPEVDSLAGSFEFCCLSEEAPASDMVDEQLRDAEITLDLIGRDPPEGSWVVVDNYSLDSRWERRVRDEGYRVMVIDDFRNRLHHADLLVSDSEIPFDPALNERGTSAQTRVGKQYALIGPEYAYTSSPPYRRTGPKRLLICYGGSDSTAETLKAMEAIGGLCGTATTRNLIARVDIVVGPFNPAAESIREAAQTIPNIVVHLAPASLAGLIQSADLFLTAGGNSMVEALALRKPCLVTITGHNQELMVSQLAAECLIRSLGNGDKVGPNNLAQAIVATLAELEEFARLVVANPTFDHLGAQRIAAAMLTPGNASQMSRVWSKNPNSRRC